MFILNTSVTFSGLPSLPTGSPYVRPLIEHLLNVITFWTSHLSTYIVIAVHRCLVDFYLTHLNEKDNSKDIENARDCRQKQRMMPDLRKCAGFVGEYVLDLAELFVQCRRTRLGRCVRLGIIHLTVPVDEPTVTESDHFHARANKFTVQMGTSFWNWVIR